jgi:hypothetical protein
MTRTLRGVWARRGTLLPLFLLTTVVVAGVAAVDAFTRAAGTSAAVAVPLLLLGLVAVPDTGRQLATVRRREIALARLRGITGGHLYAVLSLEPLLVLLAGAVAGVGLGAVVAVVAGRTWIDAAGAGSAAVGITALPWVAGVVGVALGAVLVGMAGALREPLAEQVRLTDRPRLASTAALFWNVLLIAAAVVAVYRSSVADAGDPDWVVLAGPALVGLAVGQLAVWVVRVAARVVVGWSARRGLPGFLASRRLARVADAATAVRLVVAATVVGAVSLTGAQQVADWTDDTARIRVGAPLQVPVDGDVQEALALTHDLDPDGEWLMAAALVPGEGSVPARRAFLDTSRYPAVVGDFYAGTPAAGVADQVAALASPEGSVVAVGDTVRATVRGVSGRLRGELNPVIRVVYLNDGGATAEVTLRTTLDLTGGERTAEATVPDCTVGCRVSGLRVGRSPGDAHVPYVLTDLDFAGVDALDTTWRSLTRTPFGLPAGPLEVDDGLMVLAERRTQSAVPESAGPRTPILATDTATWPDGPPLLDSPGGDERAATVLARLPALPLVEADGLLADLPLAAAGAPPTVPAAEVMVLAAADTPDAVLDDLVAATGQPPTTLDATLDAVSDEAGGTQARAYALVAGFCLAVALLVAAAGVARQRADHQREVAALRLVGVPLRTLRRSGRVELAALALAAVAAAAGGGLLAVRLLLSHLSLVTVPLHAVPLRIGVAVVPIVAGAVLAALLVVVVVGRARRVRSDTGRPALLREEALA